jgi:spore coat protein U-like protein
MRQLAEWLCLALLLLLMPRTPTHALTCSYTVSALNFGSAAVLAGAAVDSTATIGITCNGLPFERVRLCPNLGAGSGGATSSARQLVSGANKLNFQLYQNSARTTVWGSFLWSFSARPPTLTLNLNSLGTGTLSPAPTVFARVLGEQPTAPTGTYTSTFSGTNAQLRYATCPLGACPACSASLAGSANASFTASASVLPNCLVSAQNIDFGSTGVLATNVDATGLVSVTCTAGTSYTVALGGGNAGSPASRKMSKGAERVSYGLFKDAARAQVWGDASLPGSTVAGTGTGLTQNLAVFGRVPAQPTPSAGVYSDTVVVTVSY